MELQEYIKLDIKNHKDRELIFEAFIQILSNLPENNFSYQKVLLLKNFSEKFWDAIKEKRYYDDEKKKLIFEPIDKLREISRQKELLKTKSFLSRLLFPKHNNPTRIKFELEDIFETLLNDSVKLINGSKEFDYLHTHLDIGEFYNPKNSNKNRVKRLLNEAIELLKEDESFKQRHKTKIISFLEDAINELDNDYTNWTDFLGKLKEVIIVLGAVGSMVGGIAAINAKNKVEEAADVISKTSITLNYKIIEETFNINNVKQIEQFNNVLQIEETTEIKEDK